MDAETGIAIGVLIVALANVVLAWWLGAQAAAFSWRRESAHEPMKEFLTTARHADLLIAAAGVTRGLGGESEDLQPAIDEALHNLESSLTDVELYFPEEIRELAEALTGEARAAATEAEGNADIADAIRSSEPPPPEHQRPLAVKRRELLEAVQREFGIQRSRRWWSLKG